MKVNIIDDNNIIVFLNKFYIQNIDFSNRENIEKNFRNIFLKLKYVYGLDIKGYYNIDIYMDELYGAVLEIEHEDIEYFDYFDSKVDMRINVISDYTFLYKINDILGIDKETLKKTIVYFFRNQYYLKLKDEFNNYELGNILENSELIYGDITRDILKIGNKINIW